MKSEILENLEKCFDSHYEIESYHLKEIDSLKMDDTIENIFDTINKRLNSFNLSVYCVFVQRFIIKK